MYPFLITICCRDKIIITVLFICSNRKPANRFAGLGYLFGQESVPQNLFHRPNCGFGKYVVQTGFPHGFCYAV